jgi:hypothetical protein
MSLRYNLKNDRNIKTYIFFKPTESNILDDIKSLIKSDNEIQVYNEEDVNPYENIKDYIYRIITNPEFLCKDLNPRYISDGFNTADAVVIIGSSINLLPNGNIYGFALINFDESHNAIYIDVICSHIGVKYAGDILIKTIQDICRKLFMTKIYLNSVKSAISFYEKYGFTKKEPLCDNTCVMIKTINKTIGGKTNKRKKARQTRKNRRQMCKNPIFYKRAKHSRQKIKYNNNK